MARRFAARLLVVVAGAVVFSPGLAGTESAMAGSSSSRPVSLDHGNSGHGSSGHGSEKSSGERRWAGRFLAHVSKIQRALGEWRDQRRFARVIEALHKYPKYPVVLLEEVRWFGRTRRLLVSVPGGFSPDKVGEELARRFVPFGKLGRVWPLAERFATVITELERENTDQFDVQFTETPQQSRRGTENIRISRWRVFKGQDGRFELGRLNARAQTAEIVGTHLSGPQLLAQLAEYFDLDDHGVFGPDGRWVRELHGVV